MSIAMSPRQRRILKAAQSGMPPVQIADRFKTTPVAIRTVLKRLRQRGHDVPHASPAARGATTTVRLPRAAMGPLRRDAKRRDMAPRELAAAILAEVVKRGLIADLVDGAPATL